MNIDRSTNVGKKCKATDLCNTMAMMVTMDENYLEKNKPYLPESTSVFFDNIADLLIIPLEEVRQRDVVYACRDIGLRYNVSNAPPTETRLASVNATLKLT